MMITLYPTRVRGLDIGGGLEVIQLCTTLLAIFTANTMR